MSMTKPPHSYPIYTTPHTSYNFWVLSQNYSAMEPVLFEKLHNITLSHSVLRVSTFFQFDSTKVALSILLQYLHAFDKNLQTLYSKLVTNNVFDMKSHNERQHILIYPALVKLSSNKLADCKFQIMQLTSQVG